MVLIKNPSHDYIYDGYEEVMVETEDIKNIYVYENFISSEDLSKINEYIQSGTFASNAIHEFPYETLDFRESEEIISIMKEYRDRAALLLEQTFDCKVALSEIAGLTKFKTGENLNEHADKICASWRDLSTSLYYNEDFEGGELYFSQYDVTFKPKAGMMIYFPAGANYQHRVNYVTAGTRYATTTFWKVEKWNGIQYS
ncbi:Oxoglutarate/iron-dependent dioxygenase [uncultured Caudovirales phage]|uniref:procollagen-proline 3-dioxygenase n=1 Tax=uncultured Caudovirales phage TaxID=2100421 RepID=A0A6J5MBT5_9CAUD|nr:Oxoglutarate/iron-dependent dioxygenase [uncultured Caudovirales phage]CAB4162949.1 Oxoglutarate/iron-dependent dioxygenase [uncultured Caudovirales phage]